jgi:hypothetical protein
MEVVFRTSCNCHLQQSVKTNGQQYYLLLNQIFLTYTYLELCGVAKCKYYCPLERQAFRLSVEMIEVRYIRLVLTPYNQGIVRLNVILLRKAGTRRRNSQDRSPQ